MMTWKDIPGHFDFHEVYDRAVSEAQDGAIFAEVGVLLGRSTAYLCEIIRKSGKKIQVDAIDSFEDTFACLSQRFEGMSNERRKDYDLPDHWPQGHFRDLFRSCGCVEGSEFSPSSTFTMAKHFLLNTNSLGIANLVKSKGQTFAKTYLDRSLNFVFIDAAHSLEDTETMLRAYVSKIKVGGVIAGHDFTDEFPGVVEAVRRVLGDAHRVGNSFVKQIDEAELCPAPPKNML